jgi:TRAP-type mannitol/chloroaromatic compound transport system substrate-binding protein
MKKLATVLSLIAVGLFVFSVIGVHAADTVKWKLQSVWSPGTTPYVCLEEFCKKVKAMTNGRMEISLHASGSIVPTKDLLDGVKNNIIQMMSIWPGWFTGKEVALAPLTDLIGAYSNPIELSAFMYDRGGMDLLNELYEPFGVYAIGITLWGVESMPVKKPVYKLEDFKGMKLRSPAGMTADLLNKIGASVVMMPGEEVYTSLDKGLLDGTDWATAAINYQMGFHKVAKYFIYPEYRSMPLADLTVNKKEWEKLPEDIKAILRVAARELTFEQMQKTYIEEFEIVKKMKAEGAIACAWKDEDVKEFRKMAYQIWDEWSQKSPKAKKVIDAQKEWLREIGRLQ